MPEIEKYRSCFHIEELLKKKVDHCGSCHSEAEFKGDFMCEDYGDWHGIKDGGVLLLDHCCGSPKLTDDEFKELFEKEPKE